MLTYLLTIVDLENVAVAFLHILIDAAPKSVNFIHCVHLLPDKKMLV